MEIDFEKITERARQFLVEAGAPVKDIEAVIDLKDGHYWKLDENKIPVPVTMWEFTLVSMREDSLTHQIVCETIGDMYNVSTIFLGINVNHRIEERMTRPLVFETMVFSVSGRDEGCTFHAATLDEAIGVHEFAVQQAEEWYLARRAQTSGNKF